MLSYRSYHELYRYESWIKRVPLSKEQRISQRAIITVSEAAT